MPNKTGDNSKKQRQVLRCCPEPNKNVIREKLQPCKRCHPCFPCLMPLQSTSLPPLQHLPNRHCNHKPLGLTSTVYNRLLGSLIYFKEKHHQYIPSGSAMLAQTCSQNDNNVPSLGKVKPFYNLPQAITPQSYEFSIFITMFSHYIWF